MDNLVRSHRRSKPHNAAWIVVTLVGAAIGLVVSLTPATAESGMSQFELAQVTQRNCQILATKGTTSAARSRGRTCVTDQQVIIDALTAAPSPSTSSSPTPSPTLTPSPSPTPTPSPTSTGPLVNCWTVPGNCGFPNANNTGPMGTLTTSTRTSYTVASEVISNVAINGCVEVRAPNVTFRNVRFNANGCFWGVRQFSTNLIVEDSLITCGGGTGTAFGSDSMSLYRVEITGCENGLDGGHNMLLQDSWIHGMQTCCGAHTDGFQLGQGSADVTIRHNTIDMGPGPGSTGAVMIWNESDPQAARISVDGNLLAWGTYTVYCGRTGVVDNIRITNNRFGSYEFGYANECNDGETWFGNVNDSNNAILPAT